MVLSSAKLCQSDFLMHKNKSLRSILKRIGPNMEPGGAPDQNVLEYTKDFVSDLLSTNLGKLPCPNSARKHGV